jgi:hypothetical protein
VSGCEGLHCGGCGSGGGGIKAAVIAGTVALVAAVEVAEWVQAHAVELMIVTTVCVGLPAAAVVALYRWTGRREAAWGARRAALRAAAEVSHPPVTNVPRGGEILTGGVDRAALGFRDLHIHIDGQPTAEQVQIIRQALG